MPPNPTADGTQTDEIDRFASRRQGFDAEIARLAGRQHGLVTLEQLELLGLSRAAARQRAKVGRLHRVHEGVYAVGPLLTAKSIWMAAVLAGGPGAVLSHWSAAVLWGLIKDDHGSIDVTAPNRRGRQPKGIKAHRDGALSSRETTVIHRIPCTTVERTLLDLAGTVSIATLRRALSEAEVLRVVDLPTVRALLRGHRGRRGVARLRLVLDELHPDTKRTRSELERMFLGMCDRHSLPKPKVNAKLSVNGKTLEPDFLWPDAGLIVEADSRRFHGTDSAFQHDRRREQELQRVGWRVSRCTWEQVEYEPRRLAAIIRDLLAQQNPRRRDANR
jgi:predicted transcriptional regulator of viral defense system